MARSRGLEATLEELTALFIRFQQNLLESNKHRKLILGFASLEYFNLQIDNNVLVQEILIRKHNAPEYR